MARSCNALSSGSSKRIDVMHGARKAVDRADAPSGSPAHLPKCRLAHARRRNAGFPRARNGGCSRRCGSRPSPSRSRPTGAPERTTSRTARSRKKPAPLVVRRKNRRLVTKTGQRVAKLKRVHDAAARIGRMGEDGNAQLRPHATTSGAWRSPSAALAAKSQIVSMAAPSRDADAVIRGEFPDLGRRDAAIVKACEHR